MKKRIGYTVYILSSISRRHFSYSTSQPQTVSVGPQGLNKTNNATEQTIIRVLNINVTTLWSL